MAFTATILKQTVFGNQRVIQYNVAADAASGSVSTGLTFIDSCQLSPISMTTSCPKVKINTTVASAAANGTVFLSSCTSSDVFFLTVYGR